LLVNHNGLFASKPILFNPELTLTVLTIIIVNKHKQALVFYTNSRNLCNLFLGNQFSKCRGATFWGATWLLGATWLADPRFHVAL